MPCGREIWLSPCEMPAGVGGFISFHFPLQRKISRYPKGIISHPKDISLRIPPFPLYNKFDKLEFAKQNSHTTYGRFYPNLYTVWSLFGIKSKRLMPLAKSQWHLSFPGCSRSKFYRQFHRCQPLLHSNWRELNLSYPAFWQKSKPAPFMKTSEFQKGLFHREINMTKFWVPFC